MKQLEELEQHVLEANALLMHESWLQIIPVTEAKGAYRRMIGLRAALLDSIFHFTEVLAGLQIKFNVQPDKGDIPNNTIDRNGRLYSAEQLLEIRLQALNRVAQPSIVEDVVKYHRLYVDELRLQIASLIVRGKNTM